MKKLLALLLFLMLLSSSAFALTDLIGVPPGGPDADRLIMWDDSASDVKWVSLGNLLTTGNVAGATYGSDSSISDAELLTFDDLVSNVSTTLELGTKTATTIAITSDGGADDVTIPAGTTTEAGLLTATLFDAIGTNSGKDTNVSTTLEVGTVGVNTVAITSDGGADDVTLPAATVSAAGMLTTAKWGEIVTNNGKDTNVSTNLSEGTSTETTVDVNSSDGNNATLASASTSRAGLLTKTKFDEIVANTNKITNATHTGDVAGATALTIGADKVLDSHVNWGLSATEVNSDDIPDHNGHSVKDTFGHVINPGKSTASTITLTGGLGISWIENEIYDGSTFITISAGSGNLTNNAVNYLKWVSSTTATISTTAPAEGEVLFAYFSVYDGNISGSREIKLTNRSVSCTRRGQRAINPVKITGGMSVYEDIDVTNALDIMMDAGVFWKDGIDENTPIEIKTRTTALVRHFHTAGVWDSDTNAEIDTTYYDNGTALTAIPANKYVKARIIFMGGKLGFVYPTEYFTVEGDAIDAAMPVLPPGIEIAPSLAAIVYRQADADFTNTTWQDVRPGVSEQSFGGVVDHGQLSGLADDDHPQYVKDIEYTADSEILVGTGAGTFQKESGATLRTSIGCAPAVYAKTTSATLTVTEVSGLNTVHNDGAGGEVIMTWLALVNGQEAVFYVNDAQYLQIKAPAATTIRMGAVTSAANGYIRSNVVGNWVRIKAMPDGLVVMGVGGTWTYDE